MSLDDKMIQIDGSHNEGGGQIVRTALALSALTGTSIEIINIRAGRCNPGLQAQHLCCIQSLEKICNATVEGAEIGSTKVRFEPAKIVPGNYEINIGTAGSITLLLQSLLPPLMFAGKKSILTITGGTDVKWSQPIDYFKEILLPQLQRFAEINCKLINRGYYPKGNGKIEITIKPKYNIYSYGSLKHMIDAIKEDQKNPEAKQKIAPISLITAGEIMYIKGISHASSDLQGKHVAERQAEAAQKLLKTKTSVLIQSEYKETHSTGSGIMLWATYSGRIPGEIDKINPVRIGADALGERGRSSEQVGEEAAKKLIEEMNYCAPVDEYLTDNLIPFLVISGGQFKTGKISKHTQTNIYIVEKFLGKVFEVDEKEKIIKV